MFAKQFIANTLCKILLLSIMLIISGCGFQLRGAIDLPTGVEPILVSGLSDSDPFSIALLNLLSASGIDADNEIRNGKNYNYQLVIIEKSRDKRTAALGESARVAEYQLAETVEFELRDANAKVVLGPSSIVERKIMPNDPNKVVSTNEEEKILRQEMLENLASKLTRQLSNFNYPTADSSQP
ncbi:MAG: LPS-assembly lipoprotein [Oceanicoccus sp.]|jgi:LPS-assembly lipoprotein